MIEITTQACLEIPHLIDDLRTDASRLQQSQQASPNAMTQALMGATITLAIEEGMTNPYHLIPIVMTCLETVMRQQTRETR